MEEPLTIQKIEADQNTDFELLYKSGIRKLQQLSGNTWTDYNEHDPGITILENLCYSLSELYSRTEISIQDLLTKKNGKFAAEENALYSGSDIFANAPLTPRDYTKIIVDQIKEVKNAWIIPYYNNNPQTHNNIGITGMYKVLIDLKDDIPVTEYIQKKVLDDATQLLENNRMLTELFPLISILTPINLSVSFGLYLNESVKPEETLARILFNLVNFIKPDIQSFSYDEMTAFGYTADEIAEGPKLRNGFIPDTELTEKPAVIYTDVLLKLIIQVPGVMSVSNLSLGPAAPFLPLGNIVPESLQGGNHSFTPNNNNEPLGEYRVPEDVSLLLNLAQSLNHIKIFVKQAPCYYNKNLVISFYNQLRSKKKANSNFILLTEEENNRVAIGRYVDPAAYYSLQNDFPAIYGIGKEKLGKRITEERKAQALQLKSYLLFFEQVLADFMAQMDSIDDLFSIKDQKRTYFFQPLYTVPDAPALLKGFNGNAGNIYNSEAGNTYQTDCTHFKTNDQNEYIVGLKNLYEKTDHFNTRRNLFLDHLLARFNFQIHPFPAIADTMDDGTKMSDLEIKQKMLSNMIELTSFRGHVAPIDPTTGEESEYHKSLGIFLHALSGIKYGNPERVFSNTYSILNPVSLSDSPVIFMQENPSRVNVNYKYKKILEVIRAGIFTSNYETDIGENEQILYLTVGASKLKLFKFNTAKQTENSKKGTELITLFTKDFLNIFLAYENIYLIEHILLKPRNTEKKFISVNYPELDASTEPMTYDALMQQKYQPGLKQDPAIWTILDEVCIHQDFYSSRISTVIPLSAIDKLQTDKAYINYFNSLVVNNLPAHIYMDVLWLEDTVYTEFIRLYVRFVTNKPGSKEHLSLFLIQQEAYMDFTDET